jgi:hypothetical protein
MTHKLFGASRAWAAGLLLLLATLPVGAPLAPVHLRTTASPTVMLADGQSVCNPCSFPLGQRS